MHADKSSTAMAMDVRASRGMVSPTLSGLLAKLLKPIQPRAASVNPLPARAHACSER
jgi:hypothetical protein